MHITSTRRGLTAAFCTLAVIAGACSSGTNTTASDTPAERPHLEQPQEHASFMSFGWNRLINMAQAGVVATITEVGPVRWNSATGTEWVSPDGRQPARKYRDVKVRVNEVVFGTATLTPVKGQEVTIRSLYAAGDPGHIETVDAGVRVPENHIDGELVAGADVVLLLGVWPDFPTQTGTESVTQIVGGWQGNWTIKGDQAKNVAPRRSMPLQSLLARFHTERSTGRQPSNDAADKASVTEPAPEPAATTPTTWPASAPVQPPPSPAAP